MTTIGELVPDMATIETHTDGVHPFWGDPPDAETRAAWMAIVLRTAQRCQEELSFANLGGRIMDSDGKPLHQFAYAQWRKDKIGEYNRKMARYRMLKAWVFAGRPKNTAPAQALTEQEQATKFERSTNGHAIKQAVKRYGNLENLYDAVTAWIDSDTDETWSALLVCVDALERPA